MAARPGKSRNLMAAPRRCRAPGGPIFTCLASLAPHIWPLSAKSSKPMSAALPFPLRVRAPAGEFAGSADLRVIGRQRVMRLSNLGTSLPAALPFPLRVQGTRIKFFGGADSVVVCRQRESVQPTPIYCSRDAPTRRDLVSEPTRRKPAPRQPCAGTTSRRPRRSCPAHAAR